MTLENVAKGLLRPINTSLIVLLGAYTVVWGFWVANPFWEVFTSAELYSALQYYGSEPLWGMIAMLCGAITVYGVWRHSYRALITGAGVQWWHWTMISIFYFAGDWKNTGGITAALLALYAAVVYLNIKVNQNSPVDS